MAARRENLAEAQPSHRDAEPGTRPGFDDFVRTHYQSLVKFLRRRTGSEQDAQDVAQESIASLLRYRESEPASAWRPLLYRIAINATYKRARSHAPYRDATHVDIDEQAIADETPTPEQAAAQAQRAQRLHAAIQALPRKCRRVFLLRHGYGLSHAQIAQRCGISVKMVEKHLATGLQHLQRKVGFRSGEGL